MKKILILSVIFILILNLNIANATDINNSDSKITTLDSIYYDDDNYLYIKSEDNILKLKKDFTEEYKLLSDEEKEEIIIKKEEETKIVKIKPEKIDYEEIETREGYVYYKDLQLLNVEDYLKESEEKFGNIGMASGRSYVEMYKLSDDKRLYKITTYIAGGMMRAPRNYDYVLVTNNKTVKLDIYNWIELNELYKDVNGRLWFNGTRNFSFSNNFVYCINSEGESILINDKFNITLEDKKNTEINKVSIEIIDYKTNLIILTYQRQGDDPYIILDKLYEVDEKNNITKMIKDLDSNSMYQNNSSKVYIGKDHKIYYLTRIKGVMNFTENKFKYLREDTNSQHKIGDVVGTFKKSNTDIIYTEGYRGDNIIKTPYKLKIPTYEVNKELYICIEDLVFCSYKMLWDQNNRITIIKRGGNNVSGTIKHVKTKGNIYYSDIDVFVEGKKVNGYFIGGYTLVKIDDLLNQCYIKYDDICNMED